MITFIQKLIGIYKHSFREMEGLVALLIALITVSFQAIKAAVANPAEVVANRMSNE